VNGKEQRRMTTSIVRISMPENGALVHVVGSTFAAISSRSFRQHRP
jgi:hypothetical protein